MNKTLLLLGDSIGKGTVFSPETEEYKTINDSFIRLWGEESQSTVTNYSRYGCTVTKGKSILLRHWDEAVTKDTVLLEFGGNDCNIDWYAVEQSPDEEHAPRTPLAVFVETYREILTGLKKAGKKVVLLNLPPIDVERYFARITRNKSSESILRYLGGCKARIYQWQEQYSDAVASLAEAEQVQLIDIRSAFLKRKNLRELLCADGIHPNAAGHRLIAECLKSVQLF